MGHSDGTNLATEIFGPMRTATGDCPKHGAWSRDVPAVFVSKVSCPACIDEEKAAKQAMEAEKRRQRAEAARAEELEGRGVGRRHLGKTFDSFVADTPELAKALESCRALADAVAAGKTRIPSLILSGTPGTGKTHLTCAMVQQCHDAGRNVRKANVMQIIRNIKQAWRKDCEWTEREVLEAYGDADLLIIDEIGVQFGTDTERMYVFEIINRRYEACLPTVLITNLDINGLREEIGERVLDRLREDGGRLLTFTGNTWRAK
jgi:DNA replication protein DnaC